MLVRLDCIVIDAGTQIRAAISEAVVTEYAEAMTDGAQFPPVVLFSDGTAREDGSPIYYPADGFHRIQAALRNQFRDIPAEVRPGTKQDALWFALGANRTNGQRLNAADVRHAVLMALQSWPDKSTSLIAEQIGCTHPYVSRIRQDLAASSSNKVVPDRVVGKDGKTYPSSRPRTGAEEGRRTAIAALVAKGAKNEEIVASVGGCSNSTIAKVRREMGVAAPVDRTRAAVAQRRKDVADMAERGFSTRQISAALGIGGESVAAIAKAEGIVIHADRVIGKTKLHDSNRIVERMALDAANLCADVNLIDFADLDAARISEWRDAFEEARRQLGGFIRRLMKEQQKHGEAA